MARVNKTRIKNKTSSKKTRQLLPVEERLRIFANLIVDQLIEEQKAGKLGQIQPGSI